MSVVEDSDALAADNYFVVVALVDILVVDCIVVVEVGSTAVEAAVETECLGMIVTHSWREQWPWSMTVVAVVVVAVDIVAAAAVSAIRTGWCQLHRMIVWHTREVVVVMVSLCMEFDWLEMPLMHWDPCNDSVEWDWTIDAAVVRLVHRPSCSHPINPLPLTQTLPLPSVLRPVGLHLLVR
jgi:hypothetical protein